MSYEVNYVIKILIYFQLFCLSVFYSNSTTCLPSTLAQLMNTVLGVSNRYRSVCFMAVNNTCHEELIHNITYIGYNHL